MSLATDHTNHTATTFLQTLYALWQNRPGKAAAPETDHSDREFLRDVLLHNPSAFTGEADIQIMMSMYPGQF